MAAEMSKIRYWSVTHSRGFERFYRGFEFAFGLLHPLFKLIGYQRIEKPVRVIEQAVKGLLFDCQMCGQCGLSSSGMSCPMNCPKSIRNGPCGGVRLNGNCEVKPEMRCVWVEAWRGSQQMQDQQAIRQVELPVDHLLKNRSSWLRAVQQRKAASAENRE